MYSKLLSSILTTLIRSIAIVAMLSIIFNKLGIVMQVGEWITLIVFYLLSRATISLEFKRKGGDLI